ncbi:MAG: cytochrome c oxidase subunit VIIc [Benniella sp.]|nr:MAG: cytochrome c oxidase subunit VIIc [Benniella sp.]
MNAVTVFARTGIRARATVGATPMRSGAYHWTNDNGKNIPFSTKNKPGLAVGVTAYLGLGFALPFVATYWQHFKAGRV